MKTASDVIIRPIITEQSMDVFIKIYRIYEHFY